MTSSASLITLLPCPFCGGEAEMDTRQGYLALGTGRLGNRIAAYCRSCNADMGVCIEDVPDIEPEQVADMWNRRAAGEADRQGRMPGDEEIEEFCAAYADEMGCIHDDTHVDLIRAALSRYSSGQPADDRAAYESGRRVGLDFAHSVVSEILRKHYYGSGIDGLNKLVQQAADVIAREKDNPTTATTDYGQPAASAEPSGYAYRYPDGIRFNDGREVNGCKPTETLPYWFGAAHVAQEPVAEVLSSRLGNDTSTIDKALPAGTKLYAQAKPTIRESLKVAQDHDAGLADTQRAIIEAAERRGYGRAIAECGQDREDVHDIEAAAKTLAECMDYPWEPMPEQGREAMRKHAKRVIDAARAAKGADHG